MLNERTRIAVLELNNKGLGVRAIARALAISRKSVSRILESGQASPAKLDRAEVCEP